MCGTCYNLVIMDLMDLQEKMVLITKKGSRKCVSVSVVFHTSN